MTTRFVLTALGLVVMGYVFGSLSPSVFFSAKATASAPLKALPPFGSSQPKCTRASFLGPNEKAPLPVSAPLR